MSSRGMLIIGILFLLIGLLCMFGKKIKMNKVIGYRTTRSTSSESAWISGNKTFGKYITISGLLNITIGIVTFSNLYWITFVINSILFIAELVLSIVLTERHLKNNFK